MVWTSFHLSQRSPFHNTGWLLNHSNIWKCIEFGAANKSHCWHRRHGQFKFWLGISHRFTRDGCCLNFHHWLRKQRFRGNPSWILIRKQLQTAFNNRGSTECLCATQISCYKAPSFEFRHALNLHVIPRWLHNTYIRRCAHFWVILISVTALAHAARVDFFFLFVVSNRKRLVVERHGAVIELVRMEKIHPSSSTK